LKYKYLYKEKRRNKEKQKRKKDAGTITIIVGKFNTCQSLVLPLTGTCRLQLALQNTAVPLAICGTQLWDSIAPQQS
jgi:hypothetical protein